MRIRGFHPAPALAAGRVAVGLFTGAAVLAGAGAGEGRIVRHASAVLPPPSITLRDGRSVRPSLGDWEGTVGGVPASFALSYGNTDRSQGYGIAAFVALRPVGCRASAGHFIEDVISSTVAAPLGGHGSLGLERFKYGGALTGARAATLTRSYRIGGCERRLRWSMRPADRRPVTDGRWRITWRAGGSSTFHVLGAGRLASAIRLPATMTRCNGLTGRVDVFIGARGRATLSQPGLRFSSDFTRRGGRGEINSDGAGCAGGPFRFAVSLRKPAP